MSVITRSFLVVTALLFASGVCAADPLPQPRGPVVLTLSGKIAVTNAGGSAVFDMAMLDELGLESLRTDSAYSDGPRTFQGIPLVRILQRVGAEGSSMIASALNDYRVDIPFEDLRYDPLVATRADGQVLTLRDKGPLWIVYPRDRYKVLQDMRYDSRWVWQLNRLHVE